MREEEQRSIEEALEIVKAYLKANSRYETVNLLQGVVDDIRKGGRVISKNSEK